MSKEMILGISALKKLEIQNQSKTQISKAKNISLRFDH